MSKFYTEGERKKKIRKNKLCKKKQSRRLISFTSLKCFGFRSESEGKLGCMLLTRGLSIFTIFSILFSLFFYYFEEGRHFQQHRTN